MMFPHQRITRFLLNSYATHIFERISFLSQQDVWEALFYFLS